MPRDCPIASRESTSPGVRASRPSSAASPPVRCTTPSGPDSSPRPKSNASAPSGTLPAGSAGVTRRSMARMRSTSSYGSNGLGR